jgi:uncharacterized phage protein (TIGR02220 family)
MKRFTGTDKWSKPWFRKLSPKLKCFILYVWDSCDCAGVWTVDLELASFVVGESISESDIFPTLADRLVNLGNGKWLDPEFIAFQYGELSTACKPHRKIIDAVSAHSLERVGKEYRKGNSKGSAKGINTQQEEEEDKDKEEDKEGEATKEGEKPSVKASEELRAKAQLILTFLNEKAGRAFEPCESNLKFIRARLVEVAGDVGGIKQMICRQVAMWKETEMDEYLRPSTLFNSDKFRPYYDDRSRAVTRGSQRNGQQRNGNHAQAPLPGTGSY